MKMKFYLFVSLLIISGLNLMAQEDKNPVAEDDYAQGMALETIVIPVLENDFAYDDHPFEIFIVAGGWFGDVEHTDSTILYTADLFFSGRDSIRYNIKDLVNNHVSELAMVRIDVDNNGYTFLNMNKVNCRINSCGMQYWDLNTGIAPGYEVPAGSGKRTIFSESSWVGGFDDAGNLHLAAERYRQVGEDYFPGPVMDSASYAQELDVFWNKVWKLTASQVEYHRQHWRDEGYIPEAAIVEWPANGNTSLGQASKLAPFYDWNGNDFYDPENGDFPLIKGDMAVYLVTNDDRAEHGESYSKKLGIEVHYMYYAYDRPGDSALKYTTFCDRKIINRSDKNYTDVFFGRFVDFDLGYYNDDLLCCDTILESAIVYNGFPEDGNGEDGSYGLHPPAQAYTCLNREMDGFSYITSNYSQPDPMSDPQWDYEYYNYLTGRWKDSTLLTYGGNGYGGTEPVKFMFPGNPLTGAGWTEMDSPELPGDRRGVIISGPFDFNAGDTLSFEDALVFARDYNGDHLSSLALLKTRVQQVRDFYQQSLGVAEMTSHLPSVSIFPNPGNDLIFVETSGQNHPGEMNYSVIGLMGKILIHGELAHAQKTAIDIHHLKPGIYFIRISSGNGEITKKIIGK